MNGLTVGVAMITFNGIKYLPEQLDSIATQTRAVDHLVISDDRSTDGTWEYLATWAKQASMRVTLIRNDVQLGLGRNFEQAIAAVEADIIFTSDQDDVWVPDRVKLVTQVFEQHPDVVLVHTDATLVNAAGRDMGTTLLGELELSAAERKAIHAGHAFGVYCRRNVVTGATAAIRSSLLTMALPFPSNLYHDAWLGLLAAASGAVRLLEIPTIHYRQHGNNLVGVKKLGPWMEFRHLLWQMRGPEQLALTIDKNFKSHQTLCDRLAQHSAVSQAAAHFAAQSTAFYHDRATLPVHFLPRALKVVGRALAGQYGKFSYAPRTDAIRDLFRR